MPTGKQNSFAHGTRPDFIMLTVRDDQPVNLVGAFERPVYGGTNGLVTTSLARLIDYWRDQDRLFGTPPPHVSATYPAWLGDGANKLLGEGLLPASRPLAEALSNARAFLAERVAAMGASQ
jgi:CRISPR system Cascade subunit CasC